MRRTGIVATTMLALLSGGSLAAGSGSHHKIPPKCPPAHEKVIAADTQAVIYQAPEAEERLFNILACAYGHRPYALGFEAEFSAGNGGGIQDETLAGSIVAYEESRLIRDGDGQYVIVVRNLHTGKVIHRDPTAGGLATDLVVKGDGAVAWIVKTDGEPIMYQAWAVDKTGSRLLASGGDIEPGSLALAGSTLYWMQGGKPMSAVLN